MINRQIPTIFDNIPTDKILKASYQRAISKSKINKIVKNYNPELMTPIRLSLRDNKYYVFDGQHRLEACILLGHLTVLCEIHIGLTYQEEAWLFEHQDDNVTKVSKGYKFNASIQAGDVKSIRIVELLKNHGFEIQIHGGQSKNKISAVKTLEDIYNYGEDVFNKTFEVLRGSWDGDVLSLLSNSMKGLALFIKNTPNVDLKWLVKNLSKIKTNRFYAESTSSKSIFGDYEKSYENQYKIAYEFRRRKQNIS
jgi:hypothetical protein